MMVSGVNVIELCIPVLRRFSPYFCKIRKRWKSYHKIEYNFTEENTILQGKILKYKEK